MKIHQQIKSLEYEASLINLKELVEKKRKEAKSPKKVKWEEIVKICCIGCVSTFSGPVQLIFIVYANKS